MGMRFERILVVWLRFKRVRMANDLTIDKVGMVKKAYTAVITNKEQ